MRFVPCTGYIKLEAIYEFKEPELEKDNGNYLSIDLGIDNLCACVSIGEKKSSFLIDGKRLKSIN
nr:MAG TPA: putative transposase [Caudoviricetes sp.]